MSNGNKKENQEEPINPLSDDQQPNVSETVTLLITEDNLYPKHLTLKGRPFCLLGIFFSGFGYGTALLLFLQNNAENLLYRFIDSGSFIFFLAGLIFTSVVLLDLKNLILERLSYLRNSVDEFIDIMQKTKETAADALGMTLEDIGNSGKPVFEANAWYFQNPQKPERAAIISFDGSEKLISYTPVSYEQHVKDYLEGRRN